MNDIPRKGITQTRIRDLGDRHKERTTAKFHWVEFAGQSPYFSVTCDIDEQTRSGRWVDVGGGAAHELIAERFPKLAYLIRWHLVSYDTGPMHYVANTTYHASDRDYNGRRKGEPCAWSTVARIGNSPVTHKVKPSAAKAMAGWLADPERTTLTVRRVEHERDGHVYGPKFYLAELQDLPLWHECMFDHHHEVYAWREAMLDPTIGITFDSVATAWSEGKEPELDAARRVAIWPEATAEQLQDPVALAERLPGLLATMRAELDAAGIGWPTDWLQP